LNKILPDEHFSSEKLVDDPKNKGKDAYYFRDTESIIQFIQNSARSDDIILLISNCEFNNIYNELSNRL